MATSTSNAPPVRGRFDWSWRGGPAFVTPDGSRVSLGGAALSAPVLGGPLAVARPWSCGFIALVHGVRRFFTVAETGAFDWHSTYTTVPDEVRRQRYRGGELLLGIRHPAHNEPGDYRAAWRGQWFEMHTRGSGPAPAADGVTRIFDAFRITDTPLGMLARPRSARQVQLEPVQVFKQLPGLGHLTVERPGTRQIEVPGYRGLPTSHGELWRQPLDEGAAGRARSDALVLATPTAISRLVAGPGDITDLDEVVAFLVGLDVTWEPS